MSLFALNDLEDISMLNKQFIDYSSQVLGRNSIDYPDINGLDEVPSDKELH